MSRLNDSPQAIGVLGQHAHIEQPEDAKDICASFALHCRTTHRKRQYTFWMTSHPAMLLLLKYLPILKTVRMRAYVPLTTQQAWKHLLGNQPDTKTKRDYQSCLEQNRKESDVRQHSWLSWCEWKNSWCHTNLTQNETCKTHSVMEKRCKTTRSYKVGNRNQVGNVGINTDEADLREPIKGLRPSAPNQRSKLWISHGYTLTKIGRESCLAHWILTQYWHSIYDTVFTQHWHSIDTVQTLHSWCKVLNTMHLTIMTCMHVSQAFKHAGIPPRLRLGGTKIHITLCFKKLTNWTLTPLWSHENR